MKPLAPLALNIMRAVLLFCLCAFSWPVSAQERVALIIGVSEYAPEVRANALGGVKHDMDSAQKMALAMGVTPDRMVFLRDAQATKAAIMAQLRDMGQKIPQGGRALVYFSGHGTRYMDREAGGCVEGLLTYDGQTITHNEFAKATQALSQKADKVIAMMDACHSGGVAAQAQRTRNVLGSDRLSAKFHLKADTGSDQCATPSNMRTRGLLGEVTRLGAIQENFVQITSSLPDEVSFDEAGKGGLATQGLRDCLLGQAQDLDGSGAISLDEIRMCAQNFVDRRLQNAIGLLPHHITVRGNRNLIPVAVVAPAVVAPAPSPPAETAVAHPPPPSVTPSVPVVTTAPQATSAPAQAEPVAQVTKPPMSMPESVSPATQVAVEPVTTTPPSPPVVTAQAASLSTLQDILAQRDPRRKVEVTLDRQQLKIGRDKLQLRVKSSHAGYVYLVMLGSDAESFYLLFPNGLDGQNKMTANQTLILPRPHWQVQAAGPPGRDHLLVLVTDQPRELTALNQVTATAQNPFTYTLNDLSGRTGLIRFLVGSRASGRAESFGAAMVSIEEKP